MTHEPRNTVQTLNDAYIVISVSQFIDENSPELSIERVETNAKGKTYLNKKDALGDALARKAVGLALKEEQLRYWLFDAGNLLDSLPDDYGWDGVYTTNEYSKYNRLTTFWEDFFGDSEQTKEYVTFGMVTPKDNVNTDWSDAQPIPRDAIFVEVTEGREPFAYALDKDGNYLDVEEGDDGDNKFYDLNNPAIAKAVIGYTYATKYGKNITWQMYEAKVHTM